MTRQRACGPVDVTALNVRDLEAFRAAVDAELTRRAIVAARVARAAAWRITHEQGDDPRWTPQPCDGARIAAGPHSGMSGFIVGRCDDGCEQVDGQPRWILRQLCGGPIHTCLARQHLRPVPTVRRPGRPGREHCDYPCRCCIDLPPAAWPTSREA